MEGVSDALVLCPPSWKTIPVVVFVLRCLSERVSERVSECARARACV